MKDDPWWLDPNDPHRVAYTTQGLLGPTVPSFWVFNPAYAQVQNEHVWQTAWAEIMKDGATPQAAAEKAFKRVEEIFAKTRSRKAKEGGGTQQAVAAGGPCSGQSAAPAALAAPPGRLGSHLSDRL